MGPLDYYITTQKLRNFVQLADSEMNPDTLARIFRRIETIAANAASKIERAQTEASE